MPLMKLSYSYLFALIITISGCTNRNSAEPPAEDPPSTTFVLNKTQTELANIKTGMMKYRLITSVISCTGEMEVPPQSAASISVPLGA
jgi:hypothetical protein